MRFQFSLATLLVCMTVLAVVCAASLALLVFEWLPSELAKTTKLTNGDTLGVFYRLRRAPNNIDVAWRMALWDTPAIAATLAALWSIRRLKSRRHTGAPLQS